MVTGESRFLGLYTAAAYKESIREIPGLSGKVRAVLSRAAFPPGSHEETALTEILESYPRDSLFQVKADELFALVMGVLGLGERQRVRLFVCRDRLDRFVDCLVTIPRDRYHTDNRERVLKILLEAFSGVLLDWRAQLTESVLVRVYFRVRCPDGIPADFDVAEIEARLVKATRAWSDDLRDALLEEYGEEHGSDLYKRYDEAFPPGYRSDWVARSAVADIARIEQLVSADEPILNLYRPLESPEGLVRCKLFSSSGVSLSNVLPTFEHMGAHVVDERPYEISPRDRTPAWIYDFSLQVAVPDAERVRDNFQDAFLGIWRGELEDDGLSGLVLAAGLTGREITVIRAVGKYLRQAGIPFSGAYMVRTLLAHPDIATMLLELFVARFDPDRRDDVDRGSDQRGDRAGDRRGREPRRGPDSAQLPERSPGDAPHELLPGGWRGTPGALPLVQAGPIAACRCCRSRGRDLRSSCTRRGSREFTSAAARSRAAVFAGLTVRRTSGPRSSG